MDDFLAGQSLKGSHDSDGVFTLSAERSKWKMAEYRLAQPSHFCVFLLACAVANGARNFNVTTGRSEFMVSFDGPGFDRSDLSLVGQALLAKSVPARLKELEIALSAASALGDLSFASEQNTLVMEGKEARIEPKSRGDQRHFFVLRNSSSAKSALLELKERGSRAPISITINGTSLNPDPELGDISYTSGFLRLSTGAPDRFHHEPILRKLSRFRIHRTSNDNKATILLWHGLPREQKNVSPPQELIINGVLVGKADPLIQFAPIGAIIACNSLNRDLSHNGVLKDDVYKELKSRIQEEVEEFIKTICNKGPAVEQFFTNRLRIRYKKSVPSYVLSFLKRCAPARQLNGLQDVHKLAEHILATRDFQELAKTERDTKKAAHSDFEGAAFGQAAAKMNYLAQLRKLCSLGDQDTEVTSQILQFLHDGETDSQWAQTCFEDKDSGKALKTRALLAWAPALTDREILSKARHLSLPHPWEVAIRWLAQDVPKRPSTPEETLALLAFQIEQGSTPELISAVKILLRDKQTRFNRPYWLRIARDIGLGKMNLLIQVRVQTHLSIHQTEEEATRFERAFSRVKSRKDYRKKDSPIREKREILSLTAFRCRGLTSAQRRVVISKQLLCQSLRDPRAFARASFPLPPELSGLSPLKKRPR